MVKKSTVVKSFKEIPSTVVIKPNKTTAERFNHMREEFCPLKVIPKIIHDSYVSEEFNQEITLFGGEKKDINVLMLLFKPANSHIGGIFSAVDQSFQFGSFFIGIFDFDVLQKYKSQLTYIKQQKEKKEKIDINSPVIYPSFDKVDYNIKFTKNYHPRFYIIPRSEMTPGKNINFPSNYGMSHSYLNIIRDEVFVGYFKKLRIKHGIDKPEFNALEQHLFTKAGFDYIDTTNNIRWYKVKGLSELYAIDVTKVTDNKCPDEYYGVGTISNQSLIWKDNVQKKLLPLAKRMISKILLPK